MLVASMLQNVKIALVGASDIITGHRKIIKKRNKIEGILTKFFDQRLCKESRAKLIEFIQAIQFSFNNLVILLCPCVQSKSGRSSQF